MGYANRTLRSLPFGRVIGGPMVAAIHAQSLAAQATVNFIKEVGFFRPGETNEGENDDTNGNFGEVRNVVFKFKRKKVAGSGGGNADGEEEVSLTVPILTIVPIPYVRIDEMTIQFTANITEQQEFSYGSSSSVATDTSVNFKAGGFLSPVKVNMNAKVTTRFTAQLQTNIRNQTQYTIDINLKAVQDQMPAGLAKVLNIMENAILEKAAPGAPPA